MEICPCSPDTGDCPRCKNHTGGNRMAKLDPEDLPQGGRRKTKRRTRILRNIRRKTLRRK
jgi:hypothetical protein